MGYFIAFIIGVFTSATVFFSATISAIKDIYGKPKMTLKDVWKPLKE